MPTQPYKDAVFNLLEDLRQEGIHQRRYSDVYDAAGNQYVNFVQEGGGVLGLALVGYTYVLEQMGIRFLGLGGTSAGSINTLLLADAGRPEEAKSMRVLDKVAPKNFMDFVDGGPDAQALITAADKGMLTKVFQLIRNLDELWNDLGINPGKEFERWLRANLQHATVTDLLENLADLPSDLHLRDDLGRERYQLAAEEIGPRLAIVAADITTQTKVDFPAMASLYYAKPGEVNPAEFVRASMSIPAFFEPQRVNLGWIDELPEAERDAMRRSWRREAAFTGNLPKEILFADGGIMSNFPIDLFHGDNQIPNRPTFGVKLGIDRAVAHPTHSLISFARTMFDGVRNLRDFEFLRANPEYKDVVEYIRVDDFDWLNFGITHEEKLALFRRGAEAAARFLRRFNWKRYKATLNRNLLQRIKPAMWQLSELRNLEDILEVFGIVDDKALMDKIEFLRQRPVKYKALWIDDAFTYALPVAILDEMGVDVIVTRSSLDAYAILRARNVDSKDPNERIDLIISDASRQEGGAPESKRGITFAEQLLLSPAYAEIPVLIYAHERTELEVKYLAATGKELPANIKNSRKVNTIVHRHLIAEVVNSVYGRVAE
ncbi:patatin-like phospholipase family protein [Lewinella sp. 4G2]|uniref:patatin-like phospholipase family protein n=1 Tax=Lewinella sp. 4G2 TaxID=1803372 RepID=UPI0007B46F41|nr:patatin-like phospholipase family protein [Lewinella sp. 4G2]OAV43694.1 hypothetical protein A3850_003905 [Lewinella sp. 4G2]